MWLTRVGPYHNPQETYSYYALPFCAPPLKLQPMHRFAGIGEVFEGTEWVNSDLQVRFKVDTPPQPYCHMTLTEESAAFLDYAVANHYVYQVALDELPVWGMVGELVTGDETLEHLRQHGGSLEEELARLGDAESIKAVSQSEALAMADHAFIFTHRHLTIGYNGNRIVEVSLTSEDPEHIEPGRAFDLKLSVTWEESERTFEGRFARYLESHMFEHHVHWFALLNSFLMVVFVVGLVVLILARTIHTQIRGILGDDTHAAAIAPGGAATGVGGAAAHGAEDGAAIAAREASLASAAEDATWKLLHADVFRRPQHVELLAALLGTGVQLAAMGLVVLAVSVVRSLNQDRGYTASVVLVAYALTSIAAGHVSGSWYRAQFRPKPGPRWQFVMFLTSALLPATAAALIGPANAVAWRASTINTISFGNVLTLGLGWLCISLPLSVVGTILGRRSVAASPASSSHRRRVNPYARPSPSSYPWYAHPVALTALAGLAPFGCVFIEAYFVLSSFWGYRYYFVYGFLALVLFMLAVVAACATIIAVYTSLSAENHRWHWLSFLSGGSVAGYLFLYAVYYLVAKTQMHGLVQIAFFFAYSALVCSCLGIACGAIGFFASQRFVQALYDNVKAE